MAAFTSTNASALSIASPSSCTILWSTQTGRAKACARRTARIIRSQKRVHVSSSGFGCAFDDYNGDFIKLKESKPNTWLLLFVSTTGDGEQCDGIRQTWTALLNKSLERNFEGVRFAVFCLGDRAYGPQFCAAGRKLAARLLQLGALPLCGVGYGDDGTPNGGVFSDLDNWLEQTLLPAIDERLPQPSSQPPLSDDDSPLCPHRVNIIKAKSDVKGIKGAQEWQRENFVGPYNDFFASSCPLTAYHYDTITGQRHTDSETTAKKKILPLVGCVLVNERITASDWEQDTRHLRLRVDVGGSNHPNIEPETAETCSLPYQAGDVATILPWNSKEEVDRFLQQMPQSMQSFADHDLEITSNADTNTASTLCWPRRCTLRGLLTYCADIHALPEREDLRLLSFYCCAEHDMGKDQRERLLFLSETSGAALYADYILREKRSWADLLYDFDSVAWEGESASIDKDGQFSLTIDALLAMLPQIRPRHFSIASAPSQEKLLTSTASNSTTCTNGEGELKNHHNNNNNKRSYFDVELCVAVVNGTTPLGRSHEGLCSTYLAKLCPRHYPKNDDDYFPTVRLWIKPGSFGKLPLKISPQSSLLATFETPVMCIGAGTGIAPLRSLLLEREAVRTLSSSSSPLTNQRIRKGSDNKSNCTDIMKNDEHERDCDNVLVFGCRKQNADYYYYQDTWKELSETKRLRVLPAFSRDQWHKIYVQQILGKEDNGRLIAHHVLECGGAIYVAGGAKMAQAVKTEILECLSKALNGDDKKAAGVLKKLQRRGKYSVEAWS